jgi:2-haloalkanoic acid dehalogenase type II
MRAVIFDFYFTLAEPKLTNFAELAESLGCPADAVAEQRRSLLAERPLLAPVFDGEQPSFRSFHDYWVEFGDDLFRRLGVDGGGEAYAANRRSAHEAAVMYPEVPEVLETLRNRGFRLGVLSDADSDQLSACLAGCNLGFDAVICSEDLRCYKPHRSVFHAACKALGVQPAEAVYIGDTPINDVEGSRRAGLRPVWLNRRGVAWPEALDPPDLVAESLDDVLKLLL